MQHGLRFRNWWNSVRIRNGLLHSQMEEITCLSHSLRDKISYSNMPVTSHVFKKLKKNLCLTETELAELKKIRRLAIDEKYKKKMQRIKKKEAKTNQTPKKRELDIKPLAAKIAYECTGSIAGASIWLEATPATVKSLLLQHERESNGRIGK